MVGWKTGAMDGTGREKGKERDHPKVSIFDRGGAYRGRTGQAAHEMS